MGTALADEKIVHAFVLELAGDFLGLKWTKFLGHVAGLKPMIFPEDSSRTRRDTRLIELKERHGGVVQHRLFDVV